MAALTEIGDNYLRYWGAWQWKENQSNVGYPRTNPIRKMMKPPRDWDTAPATTEGEPPSVEEIEQVHLIVRSFAEVRFRVVEAYYAKYMSSRMIAESLQHQVSKSTVNRWLDSSREMVGSRMVVVEVV